MLYFFLDKCILRGFHIFLRCRSASLAICGSLHKLDGLSSYDVIFLYWHDQIEFFDAMPSLDIFPLAYFYFSHCSNSDHLSAVSFGNVMPSAEHCWRCQSVEYHPMYVLL